MEVLVLCDNCIHNGVCYMQEICSNIEEHLAEFGCNDYKDKSNFIHYDIVEFLLDMLEEEHCDMRGVARKVVEK